MVKQCVAPSEHVPNEVAWELSSRVSNELGARERAGTRWTLNASVANGVLNAHVAYGLVRS